MAGPFDISPAAKGFGELVGGLTGRGRIRQAAQANAWKQAEDMGKAKLLADEVLAREGLADALLAAQGPADPNALAALLRSGTAGNYQQITGGSQNLADLAIQSKALELAQQGNPDVAMLNRILATRAGAGGGPLSPQEASVAPLGEAMVERERNRAALDAARAVTEASRQGSLRSQALASEALADSRREPRFKVGKPGQQIYTAPSLGDVAPTTGGQGVGAPSDAAFVQQFTADMGRPPTAQDMATIATGGVVREPGRAPKAFTQQEAQQALDDARAAVASGRISKAAAQERLRKAGLTKTAERL